MKVDDVLRAIQGMSIKERARVLQGLIQTITPYGPEMLHQAAQIHTLLSDAEREMLFVMSVHAGVRYTFPNTDQPPFVFSRPYRQIGQHPLDVWITHILVDESTLERTTLSDEEIFEHHVEIEKHPGNLVGIETVHLFEGQSELSARLLIYAAVVIGLPNIPGKKWITIEDYDRILQAMHPDEPTEVIWLAAKAAAESPV